MSDDNEPRTEKVNLLVTPKVRRAIEQLAAHLTIKTGDRHTMTDVIEQGVLDLAKREKVEVG